MKRVELLSGILSLLSINLISAETQLGTMFKTASTTITSALKTLKLNPTLLSTILLAILLWMIIYTIIKQMEIFKTDRKEFFGNSFAIGISIVITWLSFIFLPENFIESIVLQYGAMGAAILAFIPFAIIFYFSMFTVKSLLLARILWLFYSFYYLAIFVYKIATTTAGQGYTVSMPYFIAFIIGLAIFFGIKFFRDLIFKGKLESEEQEALKDVDFRKIGRTIEREETKARTDTS